MGDVNKLILEELEGEKAVEMLLAIQIVYFKDILWNEIKKSGMTLKEISERSGVPENQIIKLQNNNNKYFINFMKIMSVCGKFPIINIVKIEDALEFSKNNLINNMEDVTNYNTPCKLEPNSLLTT